MSEARDLKTAYYEILSAKSSEVLKKAIKNFALSKRSEFNTLKVAKTIANLDKRVKIKKEDILKALSFRRR